MDRLRIALFAVATAGILACSAVAAAAWGGWGSAPGPWSVALDLFVLALGTSMAFSALGLAGRPVAILLALGLLVYGWLGAWAYAFSWVPGACALLAAILPARGRAKGRIAAPPA